MAETFDTLKTKVKTFLQHANITDIADADFTGTLLNMGLHTLERINNWKCMENKNTGNLTSSVDSISGTPLTRYKEIKSLFITADGVLKRIAKAGYAELFAYYPDGSNSKGRPKACAHSPADSKIWVRPYPDATYTYEIITYNYTADMSAPGDTNWWTDNNAWELLVYAAVIEGGILLQNKYLQEFAGIFGQKVELLKNAEMDEELAGSHQSIQPSVVV